MANDRTTFNPATRQGWNFWLPLPSHVRAQPSVEHESLLGCDHGSD